MKGKKEPKGYAVEDMFALRKEDRHSKKGKSDKLSSKEPRDPDNHAFSQKRAGARHHWLQEEIADVVAELREEQEGRQQLQVDDEYDEYASSESSSEGYSSDEYVSVEPTSEEYSSDEYDDVDSASFSEEDDWVEVGKSKSPSTQRGTLFYHHPVAEDDTEEVLDRTLTVSHQ